MATSTMWTHLVYIQQRIAPEIGYIHSICKFLSKKYMREEIKAGVATRQAKDVDKWFEAVSMDLLGLNLEVVVWKVSCFVGLELVCFACSMVRFQLASLLMCSISHIDHNTYQRTLQFDTWFHARQSKEYIKKHPLLEEHLNTSHPPSTPPSDTSQQYTALSPPSCSSSPTQSEPDSPRSPPAAMRH